MTRTAYNFREELEAIFEEQGVDQVIPEVSSKVVNNDGQDLPIFQVMFNGIQTDNQLKTQIIALIHKIEKYTGCKFLEQDESASTMRLVFKRGICYR